MSEKTTMSEKTIVFSTLEEQIDRYLYEMNLVALVNALQYVLSNFNIYFNVQLRDVVLVYKDRLVSSIIVTIFLRFGCAIKIKITSDNKGVVTSVDVWYVND